MKSLKIFGLVLGIAVCGTVAAAEIQTCSEWATQVANYVDYWHNLTIEEYTDVYVDAYNHCIGQ